MKKTISTLALVLAIAGTAAAKEYVYTDAASLPLFGKVQSETAWQYSRLPMSMKDSVRKPVWSLGGDSAGLFVRFTSDAGEFDFKWKSGKFSNLDNMTAIGVR